MGEAKLKVRHNLFICGAALLLICSFFMPNFVAGVDDSRRLDNLVTVDALGNSFDFASDLALPDRIALAADLNSEVLPLKTGNKMDFEAAEENIDRELTRFFRNSPFQLDLNSYDVDDGAAALVIDTAVPTLNLIIWEFILVDQSGNTITVTFDDETGVILRLIYKLGSEENNLIETMLPGPNDQRFYVAAQSLIDMMKGYYGVHVTLADYQFSSWIAYYRADMFAGGRIVPMYGAVKAYSFTINERV